MMKGSPRPVHTLVNSWSKHDRSHVAVLISQESRWRRSRPSFLSIRRLIYVKNFWTNWTNRPQRQLKDHKRLYILLDMAHILSSHGHDPPITTVIWYLTLLIKWQQIEFYFLINNLEGPLDCDRDIKVRKFRFWNCSLLGWQQISHFYFHTYI